MTPTSPIGLRLLNFVGRNTRGVSVVFVKPRSPANLAGMSLLLQIANDNTYHLQFVVYLICLSSCGTKLAEIAHRVLKPRQRL